LFAALALCHNVTPVYDEVEGNCPINLGSKTYQAASPDEVRGYLDQSLLSHFS